VGLSYPTNSRDPRDPLQLTRRDLLAAAFLAPLALQRDDVRFLGVVALGPPGNRTTLERLLGKGLDARLFTDLTTLGKPQSDLITPNERFYVRTAAPDAPPSLSGIGTGFGAAGSPRSGIDFARLERTPGPIRVGPYLMECAGNSDPANFGLMSVATWTGFPISAVIEQLGDAGPRILVSGTDPAGPSATSARGASWIFSREDLERAVLALQMNDAPLPADHGGPVRLVVPGWYGCACIKWVDRIERVADDAPATSQMLEFAARTHQPFDSAAVAASLRAGPTDSGTATPSLRGGPSDPRALRARDFLPAVIDTAAMPVRVEKWRVDGRIEYRIMGIIWGGTTPTSALSIRFKSGGPWTRVERCPLPASTFTWSLWTHTWRPDAPGRYEIVLRVDDSSIRTRRLDLFFYVREISIDEV
jgi:DMSO/TMAO reductase YedYZ molybdopterin-dependent catalytic subunit